MGISNSSLTMTNSSCLSCFQFLQTSDSKNVLEEGSWPEKPTAKAFVPRDPPEDAGNLSLQARICARQGDPESLDAMINLLKQSITGIDPQGRTLLFYAVRGMRDDGGVLQLELGSGWPRLCNSASYLVQKQHFDLDFQVHDTGMTPLMEAVRYGNTAAVAVLLEMKADTSLRNASGHTALDIAKMKLPEYLDFNEMMCSETRSDGVKERIHSDRSSAAKLIEAAEI
eukprot:TRINITY_DN69373_c0_g1_i1.p1 TRINITY_DN69373_c0_g1~~TRINITY_DN69373_c0_g1_i1.p1  ORF type:complete len:227 (-),score=38.80 TRINITY_DN69373_c0_g1_i1:87-767(-)